MRLLNLPILPVYRVLPPGVLPIQLLLADDTLHKLLNVRLHHYLFSMPELWLAVLRKRRTDARRSSETGLSPFC
jgi:hypothetical protein